MGIWSWLSSLPVSMTSDISQDSSSLTAVLDLARSSPSSTKNMNANHRSIQLKAEKTSSPPGRHHTSHESFIVFSLQYLRGSDPRRHDHDAVDEEKSTTTLWVSDPCPLSSNEPPMFTLQPLFLQLLREIIDTSPTSHSTITATNSPRPLLPAEPVARLLKATDQSDLSAFFNAVFLTRLFWLCACNAPAEVGSLYFEAMLVPGLELLSRAMNHLPALTSTFLQLSDVERCFARAIGYVVTKGLLLKELMRPVGLQWLSPSPLPDCGGTISYASDRGHGTLWVLKGYAPVLSMKSTHHPNGHQRDGTRGFPLFVDAAEAALRYSLAHQQLEAVVQIEYSVGYFDDYVQVTTRVDNLRFHVIRLGYDKNDDMEYDQVEEVYFPSRVRVWVGPEIGSNYVRSLSVSSSTKNIERRVETQKVMKGSFVKLKPMSRIKAMTKMSTRMKMKNWRFDQDVDGNTVVYDAIFCDNKTGVEVYSMKPLPSGGAKARVGDSLRDRYTGADRPFLKFGGLILGGDECREEARWRLSKQQVQGTSVLKWRIGAKVWVSYWPNSVESSYYDTRCIEWSSDIDLPLLPKTMSK